jgi:hypothetical protein
MALPDRTREYQKSVTRVPDENKDSIFNRYERMRNILNVLAKHYGTLA